MILIDDHEDLRLKTFTLEFFARIPDTSKGFRTLVTRNGGKYDGKRRAFEITTSCLGGSDAKLYFLFALAVTNVPLYNTSGVVTNAIITNASYSVSTITYDNDKWHHIAFTVDDTEKKARLYIDYTLCKTLTFPGSLYYEPDYPISFGGNVQCHYYAFETQIDEVRISDEALSTSDFMKFSPASDEDASVDENTLFYFDFEGSLESTTLGADVMTQPITLVPFYANKAVSGEYVGVNGMSSASLKSTGPTNRVAATATSETANEGVRFGLRAPTFTENHAAFYMTTNSPANDWVDGFALPSTVKTNIFNESLTIETFLRLPSSNYLSGGTQNHILCLCNGFYVLTPKTGQWNTGSLMATVGGRDLMRADGTTKTSSTYVNNGKWAHIALVYDKAFDRADLYINYKWALGGSGIPFGEKMTYWANFLAGVSYWKDRYFTNLALDDLRITRGALRPYQFLTTIPLETPAEELAYAAFDGDLVMTPYTNFFGEAGTASAFTSGGAAPVFTRDRPGRTITAGKDGDVLKAVNRGALAFSGGKVEYATRALVADEETFTAEFFVKCASAASGAGLVKVVRGADEATDPLIWSLGFADALGNLALKVCTDGETPQSHTFGGAVADGAWHHVAVRFSAGGTDGTAEVFRDGVQLGAWTFNGRLPSRPRAADLVIGAGDDATAGFTGVLDELRMTAGFLSAERFMYAYTPGLAFVVR